MNRLKPHGEVKFGQAEDGPGEQRDLVKIARALIKLVRGDRRAANTAAARANKTARLTLIVRRFAAELLWTMQSTEIPSTHPFLNIFPDRLDDKDLMLGSYHGC